VTTYLVTLRDRETQTVVGYYNGAWTTDRRRALTVRRREAAEAHAARMRDCCPRNADVIKVEEIAAADQALSASVETSDAGGTRSEATAKVAITTG
jgi:hypothetical protein